MFNKPVFDPEFGSELAKWMVPCGLTFFSNSEPVIELPTIVRSFMANLGTNQYTFIDGVDLASASKVLASSAVSDFQGKGISPGTLSM